MEDDQNLEHSFKKGDIVWIRDYPLGHRLNIEGKVVGVLKGDIYSVLMLNGLQEGKIMKYKFWNLLLKDDE